MLIFGLETDITDTVVDKIVCIIKKKRVIANPILLDTARASEYLDGNIRTFSRDVVTVTTDGGKS